MKFSAIGIVALLSTLSACATIGMGDEVMSTPLEVRAAPNGFVATQRAGVDQLANDPTWETMRRQRLADAVRKAGLCPEGIERIERSATAVRSIEAGTSRELVYNGRCRPGAPAAQPPAARPAVL